MRDDYGSASVIMRCSFRGPIHIVCACLDSYLSSCVGAAVIKGEGLSIDLIIMGSIKAK